MPFVRRRPLARAAVIGGGAYAVGKHMEKKKENQPYNEVEPEAQQAREMASQAYGAQPAPAPAPSKGLSDDSLDKLKQLASLRDSGVLTDEELEQEKKKILG